MQIIFRTVRKTNVVIVNQPFIYTELHKSGVKKGKQKSKRQVQYVEHLDSVFVDEQKKIEDNPTPTPIYIKKGIISIDENDTQLVDTFRMHPDNVVNGGNLFKEVDVAKDELYEIEKLEALDEARVNIMKADENALRAAAVFFLNPNYLTKTVSTLKLKLRNAVQIASQQVDDQTKLVQRINDFFDDKNNNEKLAVTIALKEDVIRILGGKRIVWSDTEELLYTSGQSKDVIQHFAIWLRNDKEGRQVLSVIADKIKDFS